MHDLEFKKMCKLLCLKVKGRNHVSISVESSMVLDNVTLVLLILYSSIMYGKVFQ